MELYLKIKKYQKEGKIKKYQKEEEK